MREIRLLEDEVYLICRIVYLLLPIEKNEVAQANQWGKANWTTQATKFAYYAAPFALYELSCAGVRLSSSRYILIG